MIEPNMEQWAHAVWDFRHEPWDPHHGPLWEKVKAQAYYYAEQGWFACTKSEQPTKWRPKVGERVRVVWGVCRHSGRVGTLLEDDGEEHQPFMVRFDGVRDCGFWFREGELEPAEDPAPEPPQPEKPTTPEAREALVRWVESAQEQLGALPPPNWRDYISEPQPEPTEAQWTKAWDSTYLEGKKAWEFHRAVAHEAYRLAREG